MAALVAALGAPAGAADFSPPPPPRHSPHALPRQLPPRGGNAPSPGVPAVDANAPAANPGAPARSSDTSREGTIAGWGTARGYAGKSATFPTDPSGVIGDAQFDSGRQFSPNWLTEGERSRSAPQFRFRRYEGDSFRSAPSVEP